MEAEIEIEQVELAKRGPESPAKGLAMALRLDLEWLVLGLDLAKYLPGTELESRSLWEGRERGWQWTTAYALE